MTQNYIQADPDKWWCALCPANYQTHPNETASTHFETMHTVEELYNPNREPFRGTWPLTKVELLNELNCYINNILECGCICLMSTEDCGGQLNCGSGSLRGNHPCDCRCHRIFETIEKLRTTL